MDAGFLHIIIQIMLHSTLYTVLELLTFLGVFERPLCSLDYCPGPRLVFTWNSGIPLGARPYDAIHPRGACTMYMMVYRC